jgi:CheY-like chemotaxis protein
VAVRGMSSTRRPKKRSGVRAEPRRRGEARASRTDADLNPRARVLVIENDAVRLAVFRAMFPGRYTVASTYAEAVAAMRGRRRFRAVYLDHDLDDGDQNGQDVAAWMTTRLPQSARPDIVVVHSTNARGALGIQTTFATAGVPALCDPFPPARFKRVVERARLAAKLHMFATPYGRWTRVSLHPAMFAAVYLQNPDHFLRMQQGLISEAGRAEWERLRGHALRRLAAHQGVCAGIATSRAAAEEMLRAAGDEVREGGVFEATEVMQVPAPVTPRWEE